MRCLARLIRCAIVASGTRNASSDLRGRQTTDRPKRERDLRGGRQCRMAAEHDEREAVVDGVGATAHPPRSSDRDGLLAASARRIRAPQFDATARGDGDQPASRTVRDARPPATSARRSASASCTASSHRSKSPYLRVSAATACGASSRSRTSIGGRRAHTSDPPRREHRDAPRPARTRPREIFGDLDGPVEAFAVDQVEAVQLLLHFGERSVGRESGTCHGRGCGRRATDR